MFELISKVRKEQPLIHNITNVVVTNFTANGLYALGAAPVMAYAREEVADMASIAKAVVLNIGTLTTEQVEAMAIAGKSANEHGVPVVLDPVGVGATEYRTHMARKLLEEVDVTIVRGNAPEVANVVGEKVEMKGVDGDADGVDVTTLAQKAASQLECTVVITGEVDVITNQQGTNTVSNGHPLLTKVTGAGCLLSSVVGAFVGVHEDLLTASTTALAAYGIAAEKAAVRTSEQGSGSFQIELINQLSKLDEEDQARAQIKNITK